MIPVCRAGGLTWRDGMIHGVMATNHTHILFISAVCCCLAW